MLIDGIFESKRRKEGTKPGNAQAGPKFYKKS
jgi:hypothetical protein